MVKQSARGDHIHHHHSNSSPSSRSSTGRVFAFASSSNRVGPLQGAGGRQGGRGGAAVGQRGVGRHARRQPDRAHAHHSAAGAGRRPEVVSVSISVPNQNHVLCLPSRQVGSITLACWLHMAGIVSGCRFPGHSADCISYMGCRGKFGEAGARVFNLLAGGGQQLEQRTVSERAMLPLKLARELLYRMLKARYVSLQVGACAPGQPFLHCSWQATAIHTGPDAMLRVVSSDVLTAERFVSVACPTGLAVLASCSASRKAPSH